MDDTYVHAVIEALRARGITIDSGLVEEEFEHLESTFRFFFPPDLRSLLGVGLPVSEHFPNWRGHGEEIRWLLDGPLDGIAFDVEVNGYWLQAWGERPRDAEVAVSQARAAVARAPGLVPIFGHRYIPSDPIAEGNPIFSVVQTDVVYAGNDLADYLAKEFKVPSPPWARTSPRAITFWGELAEATKPA